jgi:AraC-like DNA-binding protein
MLTRGEVGIFRPSAAGEIRASQLSTLRASYFFFAPALLENVLSLHEAWRFARLESTQAKRGYFWPADHPAAETFARLSKAPPENNLVLRGEMIALVGQAFSKELSLAAPARVERLVCSNRIGAFINDMTVGEFLSLSPQAFAARCACGAQQFSQLFKEHMGTTFKRVRMELRLLRGRELLLEAGADIAAVAKKVGYATTDNFVAAFKAHFSTSPENWRETASGGDQAA